MYQGIGVSRGYGIGRAVIYRETELKYTPNTDCDVRAEMQRWREALTAFIDRNERLSEELRTKLGEAESEIILGHIVMMRDPYMCSEIEKLIERGYCAELALESICDSFISMFESVDDEMTRQRAADIRDIKNEILAFLLKVKTVDLSELPPDTILVAKELTPSMTAYINKDNVIGFVTEVGSKTSHAAILARAMEIPAVLSIYNATENINDGDIVIVDGVKGKIAVNPKEDSIAEYIRKSVDFNREKAALERFVGEKTCTVDGKTFQLFGNIGTSDDASRILDCDGEGVGLFRTEFLFMDRKCLPEESEQFEAYKKTLLTLKGKTVIFRTLDIGGDKEIQYMGLTKEENPFMGFRAVRYCLGNLEIFKTQLRALLRAGVYGDAKIMIPLVTGVEELRKVKTLIKEIMKDLDRESISYNKDIQVGVMIETPSAAVEADILAREADFFSIGTNDLTGYTMAVDRGNAKVAYLYSWLSPSVLRLIKHVIDEGKKAGIPVGMCGEAAADPLMIPLLISFGLDEFSVTPTSILATRREISRWNREEADKLAQKVMTFETAKEIESELKKHIS